MVPGDTDDIKREYEILLNELQQFNPEMLTKHRVLAITKCDLLDDELIEMLRETLPQDLPCVFISGTSSCGGETTTFSEALSSFMTSSKDMTIFFALTLKALSAGEHFITCGGVSSYHPPSGCPMRAHESIVSTQSAMSDIRQVFLSIVSFGS